MKSNTDDIGEKHQRCASSCEVNLDSTSSNYETATATARTDCNQCLPEKLISHVNLIKTLSNSTSSVCEDFYTPPSQQQISESNLVLRSPKNRFHNIIDFILSQKSASVLALILSTALIYGTLWGILDTLALPGGPIFALFIVIVACYIAGQFVIIISLPPLFGMLLMGIILRNVPYINVAKDLNTQWSGNLRSIALVIILLRAGLGLDPKVLKRLGIVCFRLAFTPCLVECVVISISSHFLLGFPWLWGFVLGFVIAAVSPAVVVPSMLLLKEKGLGVTKGIPTLVIAAASIDDVLAITGFGVFLGIVFSKGSLLWNIFKGPLEAIIGIVYGAVFGWIMWFIPNVTDNYVNCLRITELLFGGLLAMFGGRSIEFGGVGALACLTISFVAAIGWRKKSLTVGNNIVNSTLSNLWQLFQPILFGLIGTEIKLENLEGSTVGLGIAVLLIGLVFRMLTTFLVVFKADLSLKEQLFIAIAWLPKATVQAAFGPVALDFARQIGNDTKAEKLGIQVLTVAVLSIIMTAPIGAGAIALSAPKLLEKFEKENSPQKLNCETSSCTNTAASLEDDTKL